MRTTGYTVKDIAARITASDDPRAIKLTIERVKHWTREGILQSLTPRHSGRGRWREYHEIQIYKAALIAELDRVGFSNVNMFVASNWLILSKTEQKGGEKLWQEAVNGKGTVYLVLWMHAKAEHWFGELRRAPIEFPWPQKSVGKPTSMLAVDLTRIFEPLR